EAGLERLPARIVEHPLHARRELAAAAELRLRREDTKLRVRQAAPREERETRRALEVVERYVAVRPARLGPIQEVRARENRGERLADAALEPALAKTFVVERHQGVEILVRDRAPKRALREVRDDIEGAAPFLARLGRLADEDLAAARRRGEPGDREGPADLQRVRG